MGYAIGFIVLIVVGYFLSILITAIVIFLFLNLFIEAGNLFIYIWYFLQNGWAYLVSGAIYLDSLVCFLPFNPIINWGIFGGIIAFVISFIISVRGKRRSYRSEERRVGKECRSRWSP